MGSISDDDWNEWKRIQHSMELEGWGVVDAVLRSVASEYEGQGYALLAERIVAATEASGRPLADVAREILEEHRQCER